MICLKHLWIMSNIFWMFAFNTYIVWNINIWRLKLILFFRLICIFMSIIIGGVRRELGVLEDFFCLFYKKKMKWIDFFQYSNIGVGRFSRLVKKKIDVGNFYTVICPSLVRRNENWYCSAPHGYESPIGTHIAPSNDNNDRT